MEDGWSHLIMETSRPLVVALPILSMLLSSIFFWMPTQKEARGRRLNNSLRRKKRWFIFLSESFRISLIWKEKRTHTYNNECPKPNMGGFSFSAEIPILCRCHTRRDPLRILWGSPLVYALTPGRSWGDPHGIPYSVTPALRIFVWRLSAIAKRARVNRSWLRRLLAHFLDDVKWSP